MAPLALVATLPTSLCQLHCHIALDGPFIKSISIEIHLRTDRPIDWSPGIPGFNKNTSDVYDKNKQNLQKNVI